jgi:hypothetical protein
MSAQSQADYEMMCAMLPLRQVSADEFIHCCVMALWNLETINLLKKYGFPTKSTKVGIERLVVIQ